MIVVAPGHSRPPALAYARQSETRDSDAFEECAQECARAVLAIGMHQIAELVVNHGLTGHTTAFQTGIL